MQDTSNLVEKFPRETGNSVDGLDFSLLKDHVFCEELSGSNGRLFSDGFDQEEHRIDPGDGNKDAPHLDERLDISFTDKVGGVGGIENPEPGAEP